MVVLGYLNRTSFIQFNTKVFTDILYDRDGWLGRGREERSDYGGLVRVMIGVVAWICLFI